MPDNDINRACALHWVNKQPLRDIYHVHCAKQCDWDWCAKPKNNSTTLFTSFLHTVNIALFFGLVIDRARGTLKSGICLCILCILRVRNNGHCQLGACVKKPPAPSAPPQAPPRPIQTKLALVSSTDPAPDPNPRIHEAPTGGVEERTFSKMLFANCQSGLGSGAAA